MSSRVAVDCDLFWRTMLLDRLSEEPLGYGDVSLLAEAEVDRQSLLIDRTIQVSPAPFNSDGGFIHSPRACQMVAHSDATASQIQGHSIGPI